MFPSSSSSLYNSSSRSSLSNLIKTLYSIFQWIWKFLNNIQFNPDDLFSKTLNPQLWKTLKTFSTKQPKDEHLNTVQNSTLDFALDPRWVPLQSSSRTQKFKFNFDRKALSEIHQTFQNTNEKLSSISIQELITNLQHLNKNIHFSTNISTQWLASSNLSGNQKQRKLRQIKHDLYMAKRRNKFRERIYEQQYLILNGKKPPGRSEYLNYNATSKNEDIMLHVYKKQLEKERNQKKEFHIIQDFDFIQQMYRELLQDAIEIEYEQSLFTQKSMEEIEKENETLQSLVHSYFYGVKYRDDFMRNVNKELFMDYQDDPFLLAFPNMMSVKDESKKGSTVLSDQEEGVLKNSHQDSNLTSTTMFFSTSYLPKLGCLSMRNEQDRHRRRVALLGSGIHDDNDDNVDTANNSEIEHQRVASVLTQLMNAPKR
ncbi:hypothetical protein FDP41_004806 [Naegleria fowleri]|uniref:Uncharacterized protein n=1 Tax=Naegleria fowleri TaxID=5763 RepID=A0A6A5BPF9_NAEFO|nr:uncharacterized protein FDP41_004806 [Naegleria fowleri]KAF0976131.1 hypothetical protein FDP41_004806 [Naegleria fowleri]